MNENQKKILVVDDEEDLLEIYGEILEAEGYLVTKAINGEDALEEIKKEEFDLIISDYNMGRISGKDLLDYINEKEIMSPFLLVSGEEIVDLKFLNANGGVLNKPVDIEALMIKIDQSLQV